MDLILNNVKKKSRHKQSKKKIDLINVVYDEEFVSLLNSLSSNLKNFYTITLNIIKDLYSNSSVIDSNSIYSKCLINEINYNTKEKIKQLNEHIDTICNTKKIIEKNILLIDSNINKFFNDSKKIFKNMKTIRNSKINYAIESNYDGNNSMTNFETRFEKEDLLINKKNKEKYYNNSMYNDKNSSISCSKLFKRNQIFPISRKNSQNNRRYNNLTIINQKNNKNKSVRNKMFDINYNDKLFSSTLGESFTNHSKNNILKNSFESPQEFSRTRSSFSNFYINQNSNMNINNKNNSKNNNNNLELSYKVIEFLSLLSKISKNNSKNNPNINKVILKFEATKKNLFELSKKYIEQSNKKNNKKGTQIYNSLNQNNNNNQINQLNKTPKDLQLILMNNNITNVRKGVQYKELIDKINYLTNVVNNLEKENKQILNINNKTKKQLINNNLLLSKKNNQLIFANKEKTDLISQINILQKDNGALMELIHEKNNDINSNKNNNNSELKENEISDLLLIEQKENIINGLNQQIKELKNNYENKIKEKDNEIKKINNKNLELNNSLKSFNNMKHIIKEKEDIINELKQTLENNNNNYFNDKELIYEQLDVFSYYAVDEPKNNIIIKKEFNSNELILAQIEKFSVISKFKKINTENIINNEIKNKDILINNLELKIKQLNEMIIEKEKEIENNKNENIILKKYMDESKKKKSEETEEKKKYMEEIQKLKKENKEIIEEKSDLSNDYENLFLSNKNLEITLLSKEEEIKKKDKTIKELKAQIKELKNSDDNYENFDNDIYDETNNSKNIKNKSNSKNNNFEFDIESYNEMVSQLKDEIKGKENEIEYLKIENQELKSKNEEYEELFNNSSMRQNYELNDKNNNNNINNLEEKIKFLTERNEYYQKLYSENKIKLQNEENLNQKLRNENEELKKIQNSSNLNNNSFSNKLMSLRDKIIEQNEKKELLANNSKKIYDSENYIILSDKKFGELKWYLLTSKNKNHLNNSDFNVKYNYENLIWVPKTNLKDIDKFNEYNNIEDKEEEKYHKINKSDNTNYINKEKEISFSSNVNNFSFNNISYEHNKSKTNNNNKINDNSKRDSVFSLGNNYNNNNVDETNNSDCNKLLEKLRVALEQLSKMEDRYMKLQNKNISLKEKVKKFNKNNSIKITISEDSNDMSNEIDNNISDGNNDALSKLNANTNTNKNVVEQKYVESLLNELEATKNTLVMIKQVLKELEKKFETVKQISENLFSKLTLKKKEKEEFTILLKVMEFTDEKISFILDKKKK